MKPDDTRHRRGLVAARVCGAFLALYLAFAPGPAATQELQVIELHYRLADAVIPTLQPLLEPGGVLTGMDNMLFVRTGPANFEQIRQAVAMLDRKPRQLTISVGQGTVATDSGAGVRGSATVSAGDVQVGVRARARPGCSAPGHPCPRLPGRGGTPGARRDRACSSGTGRGRAPPRLHPACAGTAC